MRARLVGVCLSAAFVVSGCSTQETTEPGVAPPAAAHTASTPARAQSAPAHGAASGEALLYVSGVEGDKGWFLRSLTYPQGAFVADLTGFYAAGGLCVDASGDLFVVGRATEGSYSTTIYEYAPGGTTPINSLSEPGAGLGCAVDPTTGNLAVANVNDDSNPYNKGWGDVAVFESAKGNPQMYYNSGLPSFYFCGYDSGGNLYLSAWNYSAQQFALTSIAYEGSSIGVINLNAKLYGDNFLEPSVQWDGKNMAVSSISYGPIRSTVVIYRVKVSGSNATVIGTTKLTVKNHARMGQIWIQGDAALSFVISAKFAVGVGIWRYPKGGDHPSILRKLASLREGGEVFGIAVSPAAPR